MASFKDIKAGCGSRRRYADGGAVSSERKGSKTVINIVTPPAAAAASAPPVPPMPNSPSPSEAPVPPAAAAMALGQMQGKPGAPGAFARGGRVSDAAQDKRTLKAMVKPSALKRANGGTVASADKPKQKAGSSSGKGRLQETTWAKKNAPKGRGA